MNKPLAMVALAAVLALGPEPVPANEIAQMGLKDKPPGTPGNGPGRGNGPPAERPGNGNPGNGNPGGDSGPGRPSFLPSPPGHDRPENPIDDGLPGLGLGRDLAPGQCEADPDFLIPGPAGQAGASHTAHVSFIALDETGEIDASEDAPWGRMTYFWIAPTFDFVFNGHNLEVGDEENTEYTLVAELTEGDSVSLLCLESGIVNDGGNVHILASLELDSHLPPGLDPGVQPESGDEPPGIGLALLPAEGVDCATGETTGLGEGTPVFSVQDVLYVDTDLLESDDSTGG